MDSVTHIVLGACIGEALCGQKIGKKALLIGAIAQSIPDLDFITSMWLPPAEQLLAHRGISHSFIFVFALSPLLGFIMSKGIRRVSFSAFTLLFLIEMSTHLFLDAFNNYGVGWLEPFSHVRISFNTVYVADVLMTIVPLIAALVLLFSSLDYHWRRIWTRLGIAWCFVYLCICMVNKLYISRQVEQAFKAQGISHVRYFTTPAPLQSFLWMVVTGDEKGFYVAYRSVFDENPKITFTFFPSNEQLLEPIKNEEEVVLLKRFSQGFYTVDKSSDTLIFNDLRFGQIIGWHDPKEKFVFHYYLHQPDNELVVQRGRFAKWDRASIISFLKRIKGN
ncbi:MAG: metal-dependent hydrolase [Chitinophagaceae bacterium]|nr:metal-dependent hydrolase [Chitinophagaceae bacterium]